MSISVNTNMASLTSQLSLSSATTKMNNAMERLSTGYRINSSKDDAAGMAVSTKLSYKISSLKVAKTNAQMGAAMLDTSEGVFDTIQTNLQRVRDLTEQAANGTYGSDSMNAIITEVKARLNEITRVANSTEFNGQFLMDGSIDHDINLQVGIENNSNSVITLDENLFKSADASAIIGTYKDPVTGTTYTTIDDIMQNAFNNDTKARAFLDNIDNAISNITDRITTIGGIQQRILSAVESTQVMSTSMTSAVSQIKDADVATESSNYVKEQILQQISTSMLTTANQAPAIAMNLLG